MKAQENITNIINACSTCQSLKTIPAELHQQPGSTPPSRPCTVYAVDNLRRYIKQFIFILRDTFHHIQQLNLHPMSDMTREAIILGISHFRPSNQTPVIIRVDSASGIYAL